MLAAGALADERPVTDAIKNALNVIFTSSKLASSETGKQAVATMLENCKLQSTPFSNVLTETFHAVDECKNAVVDKSDKLFLTAVDKQGFDNCTNAVKSVYLQHGGVNFLAQPEITPAQMLELKHCADGQGDLSEAFGIVLNRHAVRSGHGQDRREAGLCRRARLSTQFVGEQRTATLRQMQQPLSFEQVAQDRRELHLEQHSLLPGGVHGHDESPGVRSARPPLPPFFSESASPSLLGLGSSRTRSSRSRRSRRDATSVACAPDRGRPARMS